MSRRLAKNETVLLVVFAAIAAVAALLFAVAPAMQNKPQEYTPSAEPTEEDRAIQQQFIEKSLDYEQSIQDQIEIIPLGNTGSLANTEGGSPFVSWDGTMEITIKDAQLYDSLESAQAVHDLGAVHAIEVQAHDYYGPNVKLLVMTVAVHNIDAISWSSDSDLFDTNPLLVPYYPEASALEESGITPWTSYWGCPLATFDGAPANAPDNKKASFELLPGETRTLTLGYWVPGNGSTGMPACTDYARLIVRPSLSNEAGTVIFELGLSSDGSDA